MGRITDGTGPFTRSQAKEQGIEPDHIARLLRTGSWVRLRSGIYVTAADRARAATSDATLHAQDAQALQLALTRKNLAAAGTSAARILGLELLEEPPPELVMVTDDPGVAGTHRDGYFLRVAPLGPEYVTRRHDVRITTPARTAVDVAAYSGVDAGVVVIESAYRKKELNPHQLRQVVDHAEGRPGIMRAREALALAHPGTESVLETVSLLTMRRIGIPIPEVQVTFMLGGQEVRVDFFWRHIRLVGEADGMAKYELNGRRPMAALRDEREREQGIRDQDCDVVRWNWHIANSPRLLQARLSAAFARAEAQMQGRAS